LLPVAR
jgi:hypothetical protein